MCMACYGDDEIRIKLKQPSSAAVHKPVEIQTDPLTCTLNKPLAMAIPPDGVHLSCPVHPKGHHIYGQQVRC